MSASPVRRSRRVTAGRSPARFDPSKPANLWADADPGTAPGKEGSSARAQATVGVASPAAAADGHTGRWTVLGVWWVAHALVGGVGRVAFDIALPYILADPAVDLPEMIKIGTVSTIAGKLCSGPISAALGPRLVGFFSLVISGALLVACRFELLTLYATLALLRFFACATWPATNQLLCAWFDGGEHGRIWGIMSTASRTGIVATTASLGVLGSGYDYKTRDHFFVTGGLMLLWSVAVLIGMEDTPKSAAGGAGGGDGEGAAAAVGAVDASKTASETAKANAVAAATGASYGSEMARAAANPLIWCAALGQMTATPIAEFQSQVPYVLQSDATLSPGAVNAGTMSWHLGILCAVLGIGRLMDAASMPKRGALIGGPMAVNAALFGTMAFYGVGSDSAVFAGVNKLPLIFLLGATGAPANYLVTSTTVGRWVHPLAMATVSAIIDTLGYVGTIALVQLSSKLSAALDETGGAAGLVAPVAGVTSSGVPSSVFVVSGLFAGVNLANSIALYSLETYRANEKAKLE